MKTNSKSLTYDDLKAVVAACKPIPVLRFSKWLKRGTALEVTIPQEWRRTGDPATVVFVHPDDWDGLPEPPA
jgi:hypothetical protein